MIIILIYFYEHSLAQQEKPSGNVLRQSFCNFAADIQQKLFFMEQIGIYGNLLKEITEKVLRKTLVSFI